MTGQAPGEQDETGQAPIDSAAAAAALAEASRYSRQGVDRGRAPRWLGAIWSVCLGAIYWSHCLPEPWSLIILCVVLVIEFAILIMYRRIVPVQTNGFRQPRTLWMPVVLVVLMTGVFLGLDSIQQSARTTWLWIVAGVVMTGVAAVFWWAYNRAFRRVQLRGS